MWKKILLTIPALLVGPAVVLIVFVLGYDWPVTGAAMTALISSGSAVAAVWRRNKDPGETDPNNRTNKLIRVGIWSGAAIIVFIITYIITVEKPTDNAKLLTQAGETILRETQCDPQYDAPSGLDQPFIVVEERDLESFPVQLDTAIQALPPDEQQRLSDTIGFLMSAIGTHIS